MKDYSYGEKEKIDSVVREKVKENFTKINLNSCNLIKKNIISCIDNVAISTWTDPTYIDEQYQ